MKSSSCIWWWRQYLSSSSCGHMTPSHKWIMRLHPNPQLQRTHAHNTHTKRTQHVSYHTQTALKYQCVGNYNYRKTIMTVLTRIPVMCRGIQRHSQELHFLIGHKNTNSLAGWYTGEGEGRRPRQKKGSKEKASWSRCVFDRLSTPHLLQQKWRQILS